MLSIVIPVGRVDRWLDEAMASALQEPQLDLEVIAVFNNGAMVPAGWSFLNDSRVRVLETPDSLGPAGAGQRGIDAAKGEFLVCLDSDDVMYADRLNAQLAWMRDHPETVLVGSQVDWINDDGVRVGAFALPSGADVRPDLVKLNVVPHSSWMVRLVHVREIGGYNLMLHQMEDYELLLRLGVLGPIAILSEALTGYRLHDAQLSRAVRPNESYVAVIAKARTALGREIGLTRWQIFAARIWWEAQQWIMFVGRRLKR